MNASTGNHPQGDAKRTSILAAALAHFLKHGYRGAAMAGIARDADVSTATLYKHFASKEDLFVAVAVDAAEKVRESVGPISQKMSPGDLFTKLMLSYQVAQIENRVNDLFRIVLAESSSSPSLAREITEKIVKSRHRNVKTLLDMMIEQGVLKPHDTELGATFAMGMIKELFVWPAFFNPDYKIPEDAYMQAEQVKEVYLALHGTANQPRTAAE
jgi:TetR/AcrR family transcriptional regulator of autoinduction and epiphytic fitness